MADRAARSLKSDVGSSGQKTIMNLGRCAVGAVDRDHVLRACGHDHYAIENCAQSHIIAGLAERLTPRDLTIEADRDIHPEVQGGRAFWRAQIELPEGRPQVVGAVVMVMHAAKRSSCRDWQLKATAETTASVTFSR